MDKDTAGNRIVIRSINIELRNAFANRSEIPLFLDTFQFLQTTDQYIIVNI